MKYATFVTVILLAGATASKGKPKIKVEFHMESKEAGAIKIKVKGETTSKELTVRKKPLIELHDIASAAVIADPQVKGQRQIRVTLTSHGGEKFANATLEGLGKKMAIIINDQVVSAPTIREPILGGRISISGHFSERKAKHIADRINSAVKK